MNEWTEISLTVSQNDADTAAAIAQLFASGGLYIEDYSDLEEQVMAIARIDLIEESLRSAPKDCVTIHLYISPDDDAAQVVSALVGRLNGAGVRHSFAQKGVHAEDWENAWKQYYHTIEIGRRLAIVPGWEQYTGQGRTVLKMDPGMAFGTGTHETTSLCLGVLDALVQGGERVLDIGTGSGILGIAAILLGAQDALGIDIDAMAVRTAGENAQRNGVQNSFTATVGELAQKASGKYEIITANIVADAIIRLAPSVPPLLAGGGKFIASGIIEERCDEVEQALQRAGMCVLQKLCERGWVALVCEKSGNS